MALLQDFLKNIRATVGENVFNVATPAEMQALLTAWRRGITPDEAAARFTARRKAIEVLDYDAYMADVNDGLRNHAHSVEQEVEALSNEIVSATAAHGPVRGLLYFSHRAQQLPLLEAKLKVYTDVFDMLGMLKQGLGSAKLALEAGRVEVVQLLVNLRDPDGSREMMGTSEALKKVIKILDNAL